MKRISMSGLALVMSLSINSFGQSIDPKGAELLGKFLAKGASMASSLSQVTAENIKSLEKKGYKVTSLKTEENEGNLEGHQSFAFAIRMVREESEAVDITFDLGISEGLKSQKIYTTWGHNVKQGVVNFPQPGVTMAN